MAKEEIKSADEKTRHAFSTFSGVFVPSILTILGVIMFLRAGFVVGQAGILGALLVLALAEVIVLLTALSISAISTNTPVSGGGAYFLISRVMGPEFGGAIGIALYFAQALSIPFYILGFTEALVTSAPVLSPYTMHIAMGTAVVLFVINLVGTGWAIKAQHLVFAVLVLAIISFVGGAIVRFDAALFEANWQAAYSSTDFNFWVIFAIYFPAVTGIMTGVNMSGDLKDPARSLVRGTLGAIAVGFLVYAVQMLLCGGSQTREQLINEPYASLAANALLGTGFLVAAGVFAGAISSAMGSFMGAPRVMQALGRDHILGAFKPFARGSKKGDEPFRALWLTCFLTLAVLFLAGGRGGKDAFNFVARIVSMLFLWTYGIVNLAAFVEAFGSNPSFRPRFKYFHWVTALLGALGCVGVMFLIDAAYALLAVVMIAILFYLISRRVVKATYGDARRGFVYAALRKQLFRLETLETHAKNWRPTILILSGNPKTRQVLVQYGVWLEAGRGIVSIVEIVTGDMQELAARREGALDRLQTFVQKNNLRVIPDVLVTPNFDEGISMLLQAHSIGPIKPNVVMMGWPREPERIEPFARHLNSVRLLGKSLVVVVDPGVPMTYGQKRIDLWWRGKENGSLMIILAHLLTENWIWARTRIRILREISEEAGRRPAYEAMEQLVEAARIDAEIEVVVSDEPFPTVLRRYSKDATAVFLGFQPPEEENARSFFDGIDVMLMDMPTSILVYSSGDADLLA